MATELMFSLFSLILCYGLVNIKEGYGTLMAVFPALANHSPLCSSQTPKYRLWKCLSLLLVTGTSEQPFPVLMGEVFEQSSHCSELSIFKWKCSAAPPPSFIHTGRWRGL